MSKQEYYEYCFECECNGEMPLSFEEVSPQLRGLYFLA